MIWWVRNGYRVRGYGDRWRGVPTTAETAEEAIAKASPVLQADTQLNPNGDVDYWQPQYLQAELLTRPVLAEMERSWWKPTP